MAMLAVFESDIGVLLWLGDAPDVAAAARALRDQNGGWHSADLFEGDDDLLVYRLVDGEAAKLETWWAAGKPVGNFPHLADAGTVYTVAEVTAMLADAPDR